MVGVDVQLFVSSVLALLSPITDYKISSSF